MENNLNTLVDPVLKKGALIIRSLNHRLRQLIILDISSSGNRRTVTDIKNRLHIEQSVASQHLAILRKAKIVITQRDGKYIYYSVNNERIEQVKGICRQLN